MGRTGTAVRAALGMHPGRQSFLGWVGRIGGRAQLIALASLIVLGAQATLLVYSLDRGFGILSNILVSSSPL